MLSASKRVLLTELGLESPSAKATGNTHQKKQGVSYRCAWSVHSNSHVSL